MLHLSVNFVEGKRKNKMALSDIFYDRYNDLTLLDGKSGMDWVRQFGEYHKFFGGFCMLIRDDFLSRFEDYSMDQMSLPDGIIRKTLVIVSREIGRGDLFSPEGGYFEENYVAGLFSWMTVHDKLNKEEAETFLKERMSFIEVFFRVIESYFGDDLSRFSSSINQDNLKAVENWISEINGRLWKGNIPFQYRDGFLLPSNDKLISRKVEEPFWDIIADSKWNQTMQHMLEAVDQQVSNPSTAANEAQLALESVLNEFFGKGRGTIHAKTSNLLKRKIISAHEQFMIDEFFSKVRNQSSHAKNASEPGPPVKRSYEEAEWIIGFCMYTIRRVIFGSKSKLQQGVLREKIIKLIPKSWFSE